MKTRNFLKFTRRLYTSRNLGILDSALKFATVRGHEMKFDDFVPGERGGLWEYRCICCERIAWVEITADRDPRDLDVGGEAVFTDCLQKL